MLNFFRRRDLMVRALLGFFLVVICISMVLYLIPGLSSGSSAADASDLTVATVNGAPISGVDLNNELARIEQGQQIPAQLAPMFGRQILKNMIVEQALVDQAHQLGFAATTDEIVQSAKSQAPQLYSGPGGAYIGDDQAAQLLDQQLHMSLQGFQDRVREDVLAGKVYDLVTDPVRVSDAEVRQQYRQDNEKAKVDYVVLKPADLAAEVQVAPQALEAYYKQHQANYMSPERRKIEVVLANTSQIGAQIPVTDIQVQQYYQQNIATYTHAERVKAAHILLTFPGTPGTPPSPADLEKTRQKAEAVLKQVQAPGADFAAIAKKNSQDPGSAVQGGELGWIVRGQTVPNFEKAAFSLPVGQISGLIQTEYGFHIIKVEAHEQARVQPLAEVRDQVVQQIQGAQAAAKAQNLINQAQSLAQRSPLADVAKQLDLQYFDTTPLTRADPVAGIGVNPDFATAVFATSVGGMTPPINVAQGYAMAKVDQIVPPGPQSFADVQAAVATDYKQDQAKQLAQTKAQELDQAAQKEGLKAAAASLHLTMKTSEPILRTGTLGDAGSISAFADQLFALKPGQAGPVAASGDNQIVYALNALQEPSDADFAAQSNTVTQNLVQQKRSAVFQAYSDALVDNLTKAGKIKLNETAFQRALGGPADQQPNAPPTPPVPASPFGA